MHVHGLRHSAGDGVALQLTISPTATATASHTAIAARANRRAVTSLSRFGLKYTSLSPCKIFRSDSATDDVKKSRALWLIWEIRDLRHSCVLGERIGRIQERSSLGV